MLRSLSLAVLALGSATLLTAQKAPADPCKEGGCKVSISIEPEILADLNQKQINFRVIKGCPRANGGEAPSALKTVPPLVAAQVPILQVPAFEGGSGFVTVIYLFGSEPAMIAVVDFNKKKDVIIKAPYMQGSSGYQVDDIIKRTNDQEIRRCTAPK